MKRKIVLLIVIISVVVLAGLLLFFFVFRDQKSPIVISENDPTAELSLSGDIIDSDNPVVGMTFLEEVDIISHEIEKISESQAVRELEIIQEIVSSDTLGGTLSGSGHRIQYYDKIEQVIYSVKLNGDDQVVLKNPVQEIYDLVWSPDKEGFIYKSLAQSYFYETLNDNVVKDFGNKIDSPIFVMNGTRMAYQFKDNEAGEHNICIADPVQGIDNYTKLVSLKGNITLRDVPGKGWLAYYLSPNPTRTSVVYAHELSGSNIHMLLGKAAALDVVWSPNGANLVYTKMGENNRISLWLADGDGKNSRKVSQSSFIDKITWTNDSSALYMASPTNMPTVSRYYEGQRTKDRIYLVDAKSGSAELILDMTDFALDIDVRDLFLSPEEELLYFRNDYDNSIFVINLAKIKNLNSERKYPSVEP